MNKSYKERTINSINEVIKAFHAPNYLRHNSRRLEHLASLRIPVRGMSVLEVGAGIGDLSHYYMDRNCPVTITDARLKNVKLLKKRYPNNKVHLLDMDKPSLPENNYFDIVHCYGLLYHLKEPEQALRFLSLHSKVFLFLETCVSFGGNIELNPISEDESNPTQSFSGIGCRPTRIWIYNLLKELFEFVYIPITQPNHEEFPLDWNAPEKHQSAFQRAVFIASRKALDNKMLIQSLPDKQIRHD